MGQIITKVVKPGNKLTKAQIEEIKEAKKIEPVFDDESPYYTYEELQEMLRITEEMKQKRKKKVVTLRISSVALEKAKATGKGYTGFLGRLLENALNDKDLVKRSL